jgi:hypothetical protein
MEIFVLAVLIGLIPGAIASSKGHNFVVWWVFGAALFIVALPCALMLKQDTHALEAQAMADGGRKCPHCAEIIKSEANVCRYCGRDVHPIEASVETDTRQYAFDASGRPMPVPPGGQPPRKSQADTVSL